MKLTYVLWQQSCKHDVDVNYYYEMPHLEPYQYPRLTLACIYVMILPQYLEKHPCTECWSRGKPHEHASILSGLKEKSAMVDITYICTIVRNM